MHGRLVQPVGCTDWLCVCMCFSNISRIFTQVQTFISLSIFPGKVPCSWLCSSVPGKIPCGYVNLVQWSRYQAELGPWYYVCFSVNCKAVFDLHVIIYNYIIILPMHTVKNGVLNNTLSVLAPCTPTLNLVN